MPLPGFSAAGQTTILRSTRRLAEACSEGGGGAARFAAHPARLPGAPDSMRVKELLAAQADRARRLAIVRARGARRRRLRRGLRRLLGDDLLGRVVEERI